VDRVEPITVEIAVQLARTADSRHEQRLLRGPAGLRERLLQRLQDAEVTAARTPGGLWLYAWRVLFAFDFALFVDC
jgi:hypothetical protein